MREYTWQPVTPAPSMAARRVRKHAGCTIEDMGWFHYVSLETDGITLSAAAADDPEADALAKQIAEMAESVRSQRAQLTLAEQAAEAGERG